MKYFQFIFHTSAFCSRDFFDYDIFADKLIEAKNIAFARFKIDFQKFTGVKFPLTINELDDFADYCQVKCNVSAKS